MPQAFLHDVESLRAVLDAFPSPTLVVDADVRALYLNRAAHRALGLDTPAAAERALLQRGGHLLHCIRSGETAGGCGRSPACKRCLIRASVGRAVTDDATTRTRAFLQVHTPQGIAEAHFLVSAAGVQVGDRRLALVTLENLSEIVKLTSLLPICFHCRRVRNEANAWTTVEEYFKEKADIDFSHSLCAECMEELYPEAAARPEKQRGTA
ncbi:MAG TPA: PAS domain-containing protein [Anaeromyxobacter sp.]|nr:PAS domain-containing protein [Anaeromyxobacter sp.]